jgi:GT2 family glycosyltransferase
LKTLAIVILNWNGEKYLQQFLGNVVENSPNCRIIVADNASTDNSVQYIQVNHPSVELIINEHNGGFAKGYNDALKHVNTDFYLLLNSDIEVTPNWLSPLLKVMESEDVAGVQPKVRAFNKKSHFEHAGASGGFLDKNYYPFCRGRIFDLTEEDTGQYDGQTEIFWATGAAMLVRSEIFHSVGGFDESFFAHMEEIDLCWRIKKQGYKFMVEPQSLIYHVGGGTLSYQSPFKTFLNFRNSLYMLVKNYEGILLFKLLYRMYLDGIAGIRFLVKGEFKQLSSVLKAHGHFYKHLPSLLKKRRLIKQSASHFNATGLYKGSIIWARYFKGIQKFKDLNLRLFDH